jgi:hypothetical protein
VSGHLSVKVRGMDVASLSTIIRLNFVVHFITFLIRVGPGYLCLLLFLIRVGPDYHSLLSLDTDTRRKSGNIDTSNFNRQVTTHFPHLRQALVERVATLIPLTLIDK